MTNTPAYYDSELIASVNSLVVKGVNVSNSFFFIPDSVNE
jgi:hypothetical protein